MYRHHHDHDHDHDGPQDEPVGGFGPRGPRGRGHGPRGGCEPGRPDARPSDGGEPGDLHHGGGWGHPGMGFGPGGGGRGPGDLHGFGGRGGPGGRGRFGGRRASRGDIRSAILLLLAEQDRHGYDLIREISARTEDQWRASPGAVYPALALLEDEGLVTLSSTAGRRLATLTEAGRAYVTDHADELGDPFAEATRRGSSPARALRTGVEALAAAAAQVMRSGDEAQAAAALAVLDRAKRDLYLVLAGETPTGARDAVSDAAPARDDDGPEAGV